MTHTQTHTHTNIQTPQQKHEWQRREEKVEDLDIEVNCREEADVALSISTCKRALKYAFLAKFEKLFFRANQWFLQQSFFTILLRAS